MKKIFALILALVLVFSLSVVAFAADDTYEDMEEITISKTYTANYGINPAETFEFSDFEEVEILENDAAEFPDDLPTITSISYNEGEADDEGVTKTATISLPEYTSVGVYVYSFSEVAGNSAGVTYNDEDLYLVVTVIEQEGKVRVAAVHCEGSYDAGTYGEEPKIDEFENTYDSGDLSVTKTVTGLFGDKTKEFTITVTLTAPEGKDVNSTISYTLPGETDPTTATFTNGVAEIELALKDGDTVTFTNIPAGVTYTVVEDDYTGEDGYDDPEGEVEEATEITISTETVVEIINNKDGNIDTGISLDSLPYILMGIVALFAVAALILNKRRNAAY